MDKAGLKTLLDQRTDIPATAQMAEIRAPWTTSQVVALNAYQSGSLQPKYLCRNRAAHTTAFPALVAVTAGWVCPSCTYTSDRAYGFTKGVFPAVAGSLGTVSVDVADLIQVVESPELEPELPGQEEGGMAEPVSKSDDVEPVPDLTEVAEQP